MDVLDDYLVNPNITVLEKARIQAQVLVPLLRALRAEFGTEKVDAVATQALRQWSQRLFAEIAAGIEGSGRRKWAVLQGSFNDVTQQEVDFEVLRRDGAALHIDVTRCGFAEFFRALNEPELGALLVCAADADIATAAGSEVTLDRDQTLMQGGASCTFRYKFAPKQIVARMSSCDIRERPSRISLRSSGLYSPLHGYFRIISVTRRFNCLPSGSSEPSGFWLGATGLRGP